MAWTSPSSIFYRVTPRVRRNLLYWGNIQNYRQVTDGLKLSEWWVREENSHYSPQQLIHHSWCPTVTAPDWTTAICPSVTAALCSVTTTLPDAAARSAGPAVPPVIPAVYRKLFCQYLFKCYIIETSSRSSTSFVSSVPSVSEGTCSSVATECPLLRPHHTFRCVIMAKWWLPCTKRIYYRRWHQKPPITVSLC